MAALVENRARFLFEVVDAITKEIGAAPHRHPHFAGDARQTTHSDPHAQPIFTYVVEGLAKYDLAYIHIVEGATGGDRNYQQGDKPFDYKALREAYEKAGGKASWMVNNGYDRDMAIDAVESGRADLVAFGKPFIANPDLVERLEGQRVRSTGLDQATFYGGGANGICRLSSAVEKAA